MPNLIFQYNQVGGYGAPQNYGADQAYEEQPSFNFFELGILLFSIVALIIAFIFGFIGAGASLRDSQRVFDIDQVSKSLDVFYLKSSLIPSERAYPISFCDGAINTVDYEYTLEQYLTGQQVDKETRVFIKPEDWRSDKWGSYSKTLGERKIPQKCQEKLGLTANNGSQKIYSDGRGSCNYSTAQSNEDYYKCYLYGSSVNGDTYSIGYYSESAKKMVIYSRFRQDPIKTVTCTPKLC